MGATKKEQHEEIAGRNDKFRDIAEINNFFMYHRRIICLMLRAKRGRPKAQVDARQADGVMAEALKELFISIKWDLPLTRI